MVLEVLSLELLDTVTGIVLAELLILPEVRLEDVLPKLWVEFDSAELATLRVFTPSPVEAIRAPEMVLTDDRGLAELPPVTALDLNFGNSGVIKSEILELLAEGCDVKELLVILLLVATLLIKVLVSTVLPGRLLLERRLPNVVESPVLEIGIGALVGKLEGRVEKPKLTVLGKLLPGVAENKAGEERREVVVELDTLATMLLDCVVEDGVGFFDWIEDWFAEGALEDAALDVGMLQGDALDEATVFIIANEDEATPVIEVAADEEAEEIPQDDVSLTA